MGLEGLFQIGTMGIFLILLIALIIIIVFRHLLSDIIYETIVDGVFSSLDEFLVVPFLEVGDYFISAPMMWHKMKVDHGYFAAFCSALEAANPIPGLEWATNIIPSSPIFAKIANLLSNLNPESLMFNGTMPVAHRKYDKCKNMILEVQNDVNVNKAKDILSKEKHTIANKKFTKAIKQLDVAIKSVQNNTNDMIRKERRTIKNRINKYTKDEGYIAFLKQEGFDKNRSSQIFRVYYEKLDAAKESIKQFKLKQSLDQAKEAFKEISIFQKYEREYAR